MSIIKTEFKHEQTPTKRVTLLLRFDVWNALLSTGMPGETIEALVQGWFQEWLSKQSSYVVSTNRVTRNIDFGELSLEHNLVVLKEKMARQLACAQHRAAENTRLKIIEIERDLLLLEKDQEQQ